MKFEEVFGAFDAPTADMPSEAVVALLLIIATAQFGYIKLMKVLLE